VTRFGLLSSECHHSPIKDEMLRLALAGSCAPGKGADDCRISKSIAAISTGSLTGEGALASLAAIGVAVSSVIGCVAYVGGWLSPGHLTSAKLINTFEQVNGPLPRLPPQPRQGHLHRGHF
jgi:hypothetical protein